MERLVQVGDRLGSVTLFDTDGGPVELAELLDRPVVVPLVRYYGCMPCKAFLHELEDVRADLEGAGLRVIAVGGAADYQARHLMEHGIGFRCCSTPATACTRRWTYNPAAGGHCTSRGRGGNTRARRAALARAASPTIHCEHPVWPSWTSTARSGSCTGESLSATTHPFR